MCLQNEKFRQFRKQCGFGGDFYVFTLPHKIEKFKGSVYENRHQAHLKDCFSAFSNFVPASLCRLLVLGGLEPYAHAGTCLGFLVCVAFSHLRLFRAIRNTDSHRDYSTSKMDFTSMSAHGNLAGYRNFFFALARQFVFSLAQVIFSLGQTETSLCLTSQTSKPV